MMCEITINGNVSILRNKGRGFANHCDVLTQDEQ